MIESLLTLCSVQQHRSVTSGRQQRQQHWRPQQQQCQRAADDSDVLRGILEIAGIDVVGAATRLAVAEALAAVVTGAVGPGRSRASIEVTRSPPALWTSCCTLRVAYTVRFTDSAILGSVRKALEHEVACGGRRRLLPCFASALSLHGEKPTPHSTLRIVDFSVMDLIVPGKGRSADEADVLPEYVTAGASALVSMVNCTGSGCNGDDAAFVDLEDGFQELCECSAARQTRRRAPWKNGAWRDDVLLSEAESFHDA